MKDVSNAMRAQILTAAVPYIKQYTDQYVVVKYGGNAMIDEELKKSVMKDLLLLQLVGVKVVLVQCMNIALGLPEETGLALG